MALSVWSMVLVRVIAIPVLFEHSVKNLRQRSSPDKSVLLFGPSLPTHLLRVHIHLPPLKLHRWCLSLLHLLLNPPRSQSCGVIGPAVPSDGAFFSCFAHKRFFFLLRPFRWRGNQPANRQTDTPEHNVHIGV